MMSEMSCFVLMSSSLMIPKLAVADKMVQEVNLIGSVDQVASHTCGILFVN